MLGKVRDHKLIPDPFNVDVMLKAADRLRKLIESVDSSNETDNVALCDNLDELLSGSKDSPDDTGQPNGDGSSQAKSSAEPPEPVERAEVALDTIQEKLATQVPASDQPSPAKKTESTTVSGTQQVANGSSTGSVASEATIRVGVRVLDRLMNLAGELVLSRNQLLRVLGERSATGANLDTIVSGLDQVTTELQETIMQTRMQPIGNVFNKFLESSGICRHRLAKKSNCKWKARKSRRTRRSSRPLPILSPTWYATLAITASKNHRLVPRRANPKKAPSFFAPTIRRERS